jgi:putative DNA primase/helicase
MRLFDLTGLKAYAAAEAVHAQGPLRWGFDGRFWAYEGGVWAPGEDEVHRRVVQLLRDRYRPAHGQAIRDVLRAILPEMLVEPVAGYINMANGMLRFDMIADEGMDALRPHHAEYGSTVQLPVRWNPDARCPHFDAFLEQAVPIDDRQRVWEILGYLMMSGNPLQRLFLLTGGGGNGKGVLLAVIKAILGPRNVSAVPLHAFAESPFATAEVFGRLANICGDIDTTFIERTGTIKKMAGEDDLDAQRKYGQPFSFEFWGKALFSANAIPTASDSSSGWLRRWEIVNFPYQPLKPDRALKRRLREPEELEGIAARAVLALVGLLERGNFDHGEAAQAAHAEFAARNNKIIAWIEERAYHDPSAWYDRTDLLRAFRLYDAHENPGGRAMNAATFYERLAQVDGVRSSKVKGVRRIWGIRLLSDVHMVDLTGDDDVPPSVGGNYTQEGLEGL